jgi:hypothetical protein
MSEPPIKKDAADREDLQREGESNTYLRIVHSQAEGGLR